jgi:hypothetical protein
MSYESDYREAVQFVKAIEGLAGACSDIIAGMDNLSRDYDPLADACPFRVKRGGVQIAMITVMQETLVWAQQCRDALDLPDREGRMGFEDSKPQTQTVTLKPSGDFERRRDEDY